MSEINFEEMDSRDIKSLFAPLGIPHPPLGNRQTAEYRRILRTWIGSTEGNTEEATAIVRSVIETQKARPGGPPSAQDRGKKRTARVEAARVTDGSKAFTWCAWQNPQKKMLGQKNENDTKTISQIVQNQIPTRPNEALCFEEAFHNKANRTIASMQPEPPRQHVDMSAQRFGSFGQWPQTRREPPNYSDNYPEAAVPLISICIDGQPVCQMPLKTQRNHIQNPMELSVEVSSGHDNKRLKTNLSETTGYKRARCTSPSKNQEYMTRLQPDLRLAVTNQRAHLDAFQNFRPAQSHQPINEFRQCKPTNHEIRHLKSVQPAHSQSWEADPTSHIRTFERQVLHNRKRQSNCSRMRTSCQEEARYLQEDVYTSERGRYLPQQQYQQ